MKAYWIATYQDLKNPENIKRYAEKASPVIKKYNGIILARGGKVKTIEGKPSPRTVLIEFPSIEDAGNCVAQIIAQGCIPAGMEIMDKALTKATNDYSKAGYPVDAEAMMIVEFQITEKTTEDQQHTCFENRW